MQGSQVVILAAALGASASGAQVGPVPAPSAPVAGSIPGGTLTGQNAGGHQWKVGDGLVINLDPPPAPSVADLTIRIGGAQPELPAFTFEMMNGSALVPAGTHKPTLGACLAALAKESTQKVTFQLYPAPISNAQSFYAGANREWWYCAKSNTGAVMTLRLVDSRNYAFGSPPVLDLVAYYWK